jgi:hypothetical protein
MDISTLCWFRIPDIKLPPCERMYISPEVSSQVIQIAEQLVFTNCKRNLS